jgi:hypothetical protein
MQLTQSSEITNFFGQLHQVILTKHQLQTQYSTLPCLVFIKEILWTTQNSEYLVIGKNEIKELLEV